MDSIICVNIISCFVQLFEPSKKITSLTDALLSALLPSAKLDEYPDTFVKSAFSCTNALSEDKKEFAVFRSVIDLSKLSSTRSSVIASIEDWIKDKPMFSSDDAVYTVLTDSNCDTVLYSLEEPLCAYNGITVGDTGGVGTTDSSVVSTNVLGGVLGVAIAVVVVLAVVIVIFGGFMYIGRRSRIIKSTTEDETDGNVYV